MNAVIEKDKPAAWVKPEETKPLTTEELEANQKADNEAARDKYQIVENARYETVENDYKYPFDISIGQGFFVPLGDGDTLDKLVVAMSKQVNQYRIQNSQIETNDEGDNVLETITIDAKQRNPDGSFKLDGEGVPKVSIATVMRPKLIGPMFMIKAVHKDDNMGDEVSAESDGVLVIRLD